MSGNRFERIFSPIKIGTLEVKNKLFMGPMCTNYATIKGDVTDRLIAYYVARAKGGVGLINIEFTSIISTGKVFEHMTGLYDDDMIPGYRKLTEGVHQAGAKVAVQISHAGRRTHSSITGETPVAPSPIPRHNGEVPRELTIHEIQQLIEDFVKAAIRAKAAGFDAVMIHMAHGYLIHQFLSPLSNKRQDQYGGDLDGRSRFAIEVLQEIKKALGRDFPVTCRFCGDEFIPGGWDLSQGKYVAKKLQDAGIDAIDVTGGTHETDYIMSAPSNMEPGFLRHLSAGIKEVVQIPVGIVGRINDPIVAEEILAKHQANYITLGRALIADPEFPIKVKEGRLIDIRPCTACNLGCNDRMYRQLDISCQTNAMVGREIDFAIEPTAGKKRVLIVGAGPAGLEAARVAALRNHEVILFQRGNEIGGQLNLASIPPGKVEYRKLIKYYENQMGKLNVKLMYGEATRKEIDEIMPDVIIFATGGKPNPGKNIRIASSFVANAWEVLAGTKQIGNKIIVVGGGLLGCELADFLLDHGKKITILEMLDSMGADMSKRARKVVLDRLVRNGVELINQATVTEILDSEITFKRGGLTEKIKHFDDVVLAIGTLPDRTLIDSFGETNVPIFHIGDCVNPGRVIEAIRDGFDLALAI